MLNLNFSRLPKHRKFAYTPIYYDENKEKLDAQVKRIQQEMGEEGTTVGDTKANIRAAFNREAKVRYSSNPLTRFYGLRILLIAGILGLIFIKLLNTDFIKTIFEGLTK